jgi:hypothetical protein
MAVTIFAGATDVGIVVVTATVVVAVVPVTSFVILSVQELIPSINRPDNNIPVVRRPTKVIDFITSSSGKYLLINLRDVSKVNITFVKVYNVKVVFAIAKMQIYQKVTVFFEKIIIK